MKETETVDTLEIRTIGSERSITTPKISLEISDIEEPISLRGGDQNDPTKGRGDCDS